MRMSRPRVFLHELSWDFRKRHTDWRYLRYALPRLGEFAPELEMVTEQSALVASAGNLKAIRMAVGRRLGLPLGTYAASTNYLSKRELQESGCNLVFAKSFPLNAGDIPVVWESGIIDPEMLRSFGVGEAEIGEETEARGTLFRKADRVQVFADAEARRHAQAFPDIADRFVAVPWFSPHIRACDRADLEKHRSASPVRILFVGNHAARKGLDQLFDAFLQLPPAVQNRALLTVISNFDRSRIKIPVSERIVVVRGAPIERVMSEMKQAHIFVNVARLETYGVVFHEAMSQGAACLAPAWEVQRELFDNGNAGINLACETNAIKGALERLIEDESYRYSMGLAAWTRFNEKYAAPVVARRYAALFSSVLNR